MTDATPLPEHIDADRVVLPDGVLTDGWVEHRDGIVTAIGQNEAPVAGAYPWIFPGFVDGHCHGGGGASFDGGLEAARTAARTHAAHGTTTMLASLVSARVDVLAEQVGGLARAIRSGELGPVRGIHLEGPFLSPDHRGAHDPDALTPPTHEAVARLLAAGDGLVRMVTLAPELHGGLDTIEHLAAEGVVAAVGHTAADYALAREAFARGATVLTHASNAMMPVHHRAPGPVVAALETPGVRLEVILDGIHLHDAWARRLLLDAGERGVLVTDAMAAAAAQDGRYELGGLAVDVADGTARLADSGAIAGSTLTMDSAVRRALGVLGLDPVAVACAASAAPATALGLDGGAITVGGPAHLVALDSTYEVVGVLPGVG
ncbi:amidohydrolase family protein [Mumia sp.]|uniref:N-acetylglucosamine-6-phosphate deacetylase n=1 Tax=Mumia sp. TaxID=1965300 RepID=UPI002601ACF3|nr:amidohydrolase family protein [Mumia sp.]MDD9350159.1 amidohydrolase family protein [Mumia sp.]